MKSLNHPPFPAFPSWGLQMSLVRRACGRPFGQGHRRCYDWTATAPSRKVFLEGQLGVQSWTVLTEHYQYNSRYSL